MAAGIVAGLGLVLLIPTFNALNMSYVQNVPPPPWLPTPPTPPDMTPPTDFVPPTGMTPPTNWQGQEPPPCPPPVEREIEEARYSGQLSAQQGSFSLDRAFDVPNATLAIGGFFNFTQWQAQEISVTIVDPQGDVYWTDGAEADAFLVQSQPRTSEFRFMSYEEKGQTPPVAGTYTLQLRAQFPISGQVTSKMGMALACGGMLS